MTQGLTLLAEHQEGVVPKIVAKLKTGGQTFQIRRNIPRPTAAQFQQMQACMDKLRAKSGGSTTTTPGPAAASAAVVAAAGADSDGAASTAAPSRSACPRRFGSCAPSSRRREKTLQQVLNPPQTNIKTSGYTIGGVDQTQPTMGVVTTAQVTKGRFLAAAGGKEALLSTGYAAKHSLKVGSKLDLNGTSYAVVGLVSPPLGGQSADVYLPLKQLQTLANEKNLANVILVRATSSKDVGAVKQAIEARFPNAQVASSKDVADTISGSLVDASNLSHDLGLALSVVAAVAAFLLAALLAFSSVGKRVRELGTLQGARVDAADGRAAGGGRVARPGRARRARRDRRRRRRRACDRRVRAVALRQLDDGQRPPRPGSRDHADQPRAACPSPLRSASPCLRSASGSRCSAA